MTTAFRLPTSSSQARGPRRRGVTTAGMVVGMTMMLGFVALSVDLSVIMLYEVETRAASDAAVLAGVGELWDRTLLPEHLRDIELPNNGPAESYVEQQVRLSQSESRRFIALNHVCGNVLDLRDEDILFSTLGHENALTIRCPQTSGRGNPVTRIVGKSLGLHSADLLVESQAVMDHRVYGFSPGTGARIPVVPIVIDYDSWYAQVNLASLVVLEMKVSPDVSGNAKLCALTPLGDLTATASQIGSQHDTGSESYFTMQRLCQQIEIGVAQQDLSAFPSQSLALDDSPAGGKLDLPLADVAGTNVLAQAGNALLAIEGQTRVWLVGSDLTGASGATLAARVESFVAAKVVHCSLEDETLRVILAPSLLNSSSALVRSGQPRNPWVAKAYLVR